VFLLGGFAGSPSLIEAMRRGLDQYAKKEDIPTIKLIEDAKKRHVHLNIPNRTHDLMPKSNAAVSSGAVLRASNKKDGPRRFAHSSYGFLRREPYEPQQFPAHSRSMARVDIDDGEKYVDVINYFMRKASLT